MNTNQPFIVLLLTNHMGIFFMRITMLLDFTQSRLFFIMNDLCEVN